MGAAKKPLLFDTLDSVKKLEAAGVPQKQAEAHVRLFSQIVEETICSKQDLLATEGRLDLKLKETEGHIRIEIEHIRKELRETEGRLEVKLKETEGRLELKLKETEGRFELKLKETEGRLDLKLKELEYKMEGIQKEMAFQIERAKNNLIKWFIGTSLVSLGLITGMVTSVIKLVHP